MKKIAFLLLLFSILFGPLNLGKNIAFAQDEGPPAMKTVALFSVGGAGAGAGFGVALWLLDPFADNADIRASVLSGVGVGALVGAIFGVVQLQGKMIVPGYRAPVEDEFQGSVQNSFSPAPVLRSYDDGRRATYAKAIPLVQFNYRF
ncbi:MAG: hypothetical protein COB67_01655 [SAR324 cluster bacterium]|uniref:Uncharacterized protein n=1 Tax=SAR324 cluster bacterium TaxID=2024889 RepID=A0A2A4TAW4_9DELT|nr:MAG: hypothetical protein COB67_01655 [SAR324 cluster bacterium]